MDSGLITVLTGEALPAASRGSRLLGRLLPKIAWWVTRGSLRKGRKVKCVRTNIEEEGVRKREREREREREKMRGKKV